MSNVQCQKSKVISALDYRAGVADRLERERTRRARLIRSARRLVLVLVVVGFLCAGYFLIRAWHYSTHDISLREAHEDLACLLEPMGNSATLENAAIRIPDTYDDFPETRWYVLRVNDGKASRVYRELQERWLGLRGHSIWESEVPAWHDYCAPDWWFLDRESATKASVMGISAADGGGTDARFEVFVADLWGRILVRRIGGSAD
jgi:hypothetical protein